jgi:hypothetical protein
MAVLRRHHGSRRLSSAEVFAVKAGKQRCGATAIMFISPSAGAANAPML